MRVILIDPWIERAGLAMVMDWALLWATGRILRRSSTIWRLLRSTLLGGVYQIVLGIRWELGVLGIGDWLVYLSVGVSMILWVYSPNTFRQAMRTIFLFFLLTFITVGVSMSFLSLARVWGWSFLHPWQFFFINLLALAIVVELGWGAIHEAIWTQTCLVEIEIGIGGKNMTVKALIDTGHRLRDPMSRAPVIVLSLPSVEKDLPIGLVRTVHRFAQGETPLAEDEEEWGGRIRFIPMASVERSGGMLVGVVPDHFSLGDPQRDGGKAVVAFTKERFPDGEYQAIVPVMLFHEDRPSLTRRQGYAATN